MSLVLASENCDVLVIGSGAGGMAAAITAADAGLSVVVAERADSLGGTSALSGGWLYVPGDPRAQSSAHDTREEQIAYLRSLAGSYLENDRIDAFLDNVPAMLDFFENKMDVRLVRAEIAPDYSMDAVGAKASGRSVYPEPLDARELGQLRMRLRPYLDEVTFFGIMPQIGVDLAHFLSANRSLKSLLYVTRRLIRQKYEELRYGRGCMLTNGNALMARMIRAANSTGVSMRTSARALRLTVSEGRIAGAVVATPSGHVLIRSRRGVVLACGGISHDRGSRRELFPHASTGTEHWSPVSREHDGEALRLALPHGAVFDTFVMRPAAWVPVSVFKGSAGRVRIYPHLRGVGLPGIIAVNRHGKRFVNESGSYHEFGQAMIDDHAGERDVFSFLICDSRAMHRYGLGFAKPWPIPRIGYRRSGYLISGRNVDQLAVRAGIDPVGLLETIEEFNRHARGGRDPAFGRGQSAYDRFKGDQAHTPNPALRPLEVGRRLYATKIRLGDIGAFVGLKTDAEARVLNASGDAIDGLFAVGTAASSVFGGTYPGHGANLGPATTFGYIAGRALAVSREKAGAILERDGRSESSARATEGGALSDDL